MPRTGSISLSLPPFAGAVRRLVLLNVGAFLLFAVMAWLAPAAEVLLLRHMILQPVDLFRGELWQLATYSLIEQSILGILFGMLTLWFAGSLLEGAYGSRWLAELYAVSVIGGALIASVLSFSRVLHLSPNASALGPWAGIFGLLVAMGMLFGDQEFLMWFVLRVKAKYMVAIYILVAIALLLKEADSFGALLQLSGALAGYLYVRFAPRRGMAFGLTERYFSVQNDYIRWKRRRAARKFEVYMRKQNREVHFDKDGRYVDPDEAKRRDGSSDPKQWMN